MSQLISVSFISSEGEQGDTRYITKRALAQKLGVSERTIYDRDINLGMICRSYREMRAGAYSSLSPRQVRALTILHGLYSQGLNLKSIKKNLKENPNLFSQEQSDENQRTSKFS